MEFIDSHCHIDFPAFDSDRAEVLERCALLGIKSLVIPGVTLETFSRSSALCLQYPQLYCSVGLHPWWIGDYFDSASSNEVIEKHFRKLPDMYAENYCVAIGECGLDKNIAVPMEVQKTILAEHIRLANELKAPLILHCVGMHNELLQLLKEHKSSYGGALHGFSGSFELASQYWDRGFYLGIGGTISYERANKTRETLKKLPLESILLETDAPDMPLEGAQGKRNSPEYVVRIAHVMAQIKGEDTENLAIATTQNAKRLFGFV